MFVADDVDLLDARLGPLGNLEHEVDAVLAQLDRLRLDGGGEPALTLVEFDDAGDVRADLRTREDLARGKLDFGNDLVVLEALVTFQNDAVDHRVLDHVDHHVAIFVRDRIAFEKLGRCKILERLVSRGGGVDVAGAHPHVAEDRIGLEPLDAANRDRADAVALRIGRSVLPRIVRRRGGVGRLLRHCRLGQSCERGARQQGERVVADVARTALGACFDGRHVR